MYVAGVPDRYQALEAQIKQLERSSPQTYYVVVVKRTGRGEKAATRYAEELLEHWRTQAARSRRSFETDRSVLIVLDVDNQQIAVQPGARLQSNRIGLDVAKVERDLIQKVFIKGYANEEAYPEGLAALLNATNDAIADRDPQTARAPVSIAASGSTKAAPDARARVDRLPPPDRSRLKICPPPLAVKSSPDWISGLAVVVPMIAAADRADSGAHSGGVIAARGRVSAPRSRKSGRRPST